MPSKRRENVTPREPVAVEPRGAMSTEPRVKASAQKQRSFWSMFFLLWVFRAINSLLVQTQFDPDEFWQGLEPAHLVVYGRGWLTWEWMPGIQIRSWIHPLLLAIPLRVLKVLELDRTLSTVLISLAPRIFIQAPLLALTDLSVAHLSERLIGPSAFNTGLLFSLTNWFMFYCGIRTYTNSFEGCLTAIALATWPLNDQDVNRSKVGMLLSLLLAAISIVVRPSALIIWIYLGAFLAIGDYGLLNKQFWSLLALSVVPIGVLVIVLAMVIDSIAYSRANNSDVSAVFVPWNFFQLNFIKNISALYGVHSLHWYFSQCFPALLGIQLPLFLHGVYLSWVQKNTRSRRLAGLIAFGLSMLSLSAHKEMRFAFPFIPPAMVLCALSMENIILQASLKVSKPAVKHFLTLVVMVGGAIPALYLGLVHQRGAIDAAYYLSDHAKGEVDILLNCHAMPLWGMTHPRNAKITSMRFLDCSPHLSTLEKVPFMNSSYTYAGSNETHVFLDNPYEFTLERYQKGRKPDFIVTGSKWFAKVEKALEALGSEFKQCALFPKAQDDVGGEIIILCRAST